ncbi:DUF6624 domain-containing protein [[Kitasatospora] papulosa]|uniref:DUF6624 domain-containing protein n=1 Tax=Streptomyces TaxID=1883 RepID=UPI0002C6CDFF|nr:MULTISPECIES: DUF6624 domain-containing protein [unclassified Streptomyces]AGJ58894.1 hypothetical protein F750_6469 [Streptomyces sp. PAMC 26508]QBR09833.1 hypothetical protein D7Y56_30370 [Streptomyces sp. S501]
MTPAEPLRPDLARELSDRAMKAAARRAKRLRNQLDAVQLGQDRHADHADTKVLRRVLAEHDWPGHRLVGPDAARAAWSLALHADDDADFQRAATTLLERAVQDGDARIQHWAHLYDRTLVNSGHPQEFGTQQILTATGVQLCPVHAPDSLDQRRASIGLPPIATALETVHRRFAQDHHAGDSSTVVLAEVA